MDVNRLEASDLRQIKVKGGYVINVYRLSARIHRAACPLVERMNPDKRGGIYHFPTYEEVYEWLEEKDMRGVPCRMCLNRLTYKPRPLKLIGRVRKSDVEKDNQDAWL